MDNHNELRTYDWNGHTDKPIGYADKSDEQVAREVRMLMRDQLNHEGVCTMARDRIMCLTKEKATLQAEVVRLKTEHDEDISLTTEIHGYETDDLKERLTAENARLRASIEASRSIGDRLARGIQVPRDEIKRAVELQDTALQADKEVKNDE